MTKRTNSFLRLKIVIFIAGLLAFATHNQRPPTEVKEINAPYSGTCIIKRALEVHQMNCEIQPNNVAVIYQR